MAFASRGIRAAVATAAAASSAVALSGFWTRENEVRFPLQSASQSPCAPGRTSASSISQNISLRIFAAASATDDKPAADQKESGPPSPSQSEKKRTALRKRERRFQAYASCEHDGQQFLTAQDFLESVTKPEPRARRHRRALTEDEVARMMDATPDVKKNSSHLFRDMWDNCLFSYPDYLFLLSVLTKPSQHFEIAFKMLDVDGNKTVDVNEFLKFQGAINKSSPLRSGEEMDSSSLLRHFFGRGGKGVIQFQDFFRFMDNLQEEVLELEFLNHSQGMRVISELDFAQILLRTAHISEKDVEVYIERLRQRLDESHGITFKEFCNFNKFLNNLQDFAIVVQMYTVAGQSINQSQFQRAVKACMGYTLDAHLVDTVFKLFDTDGDGQLSHTEFIVVMRNRVQRGFGGKKTGWDGFKACVKKDVNKRT